LIAGKDETAATAEVKEGGAVLMGSFKDDVEGFAVGYIGASLIRNLVAQGTAEGIARQSAGVTVTPESKGLYDDEHAALYHAVDIGRCCNLSPRRWRKGWKRTSAVPPNEEEIAWARTQVQAREDGKWQLPKEWYRRPTESDEVDPEVAEWF
jgi:hypothetical protein